MYLFFIIWVGRKFSCLWLFNYFLHIFAFQMDVFQSAQVKCQASLPPIAPLQRPPLKLGQLVYAMKHSLFARWVLATVVKVITKEPGVRRSLMDINFRILQSKKKNFRAKKFFFNSFFFFFFFFFF